MNNLKEIDLTIFPAERKEKLEKIYRYQFFDKLFYRSNLWMHTHRVLWLLEEIAPLAQKYLTFDLEKARIYALVHDDAEMVTGDIQAIQKQRMSKEELQKHDENDLLVIANLVNKYPKIVHGYSYELLLKEAVSKDTVEAQLVSYLDKLDAFCESLHEMYAGNVSILRSVVFYSLILPTFPHKYPALKDLLSSKESPLTFIADMISPYKIEFENYANLKPHTESSIQNTIDFPFYDTWKKIIVQRGKIDWLIKQKEF